MPLRLLLFLSFLCTLGMTLTPKFLPVVTALYVRPIIVPFFLFFLLTFDLRPYYYSNNPIF